MHNAKKNVEPTETEVNKRKSDNLSGMTSEQQPRKHTKNNKPSYVADETNRMVILDKNFRKNKFSKKQCDRLLEAIEQKIFSLPDTDDRLMFDGISIFKGMFSIRCKSANDKVWLGDLVSSITDVWDGAELEKINIKNENPEENIESDTETEENTLKPMDYPKIKVK